MKTHHVPKRILATSADGDRVEPCFNRAPYMNQASWPGENWSELGRRRRYMLATIRTELRRIKIQTVQTFQQTV